MKTRTAFARSLKEVRKTKGFTQEDFSVVSSRTYISMLEREVTSPTLDKIEIIAEAMKVHPLTLLTLTYLKAGAYRNVEDLFKKVRSDLAAIDALRRE